MKAINFAERYYDGSQLEVRPEYPEVVDVDMVYSALVLETLGVSDDNTSRILGMYASSETLVRSLSYSDTLSYTSKYLRGLVYETPENGGLGNPTFSILSRLMIDLSAEVFGQLKKDGEVKAAISDETFAFAIILLRVSGASTMALRDRIIKQRFGNNWEKYTLAPRESENQADAMVARNLEGTLNEYDTALTLVSIARHSGFVVFPAPSMFERSPLVKQKPDFIMYNPQKKTAVGVQTKLSPSEEDALTYEDPENGVMLVSGRHDLGNSRRRKTYNPRSQELAFAGSVVDGFNRYYSPYFKKLKGTLRNFDIATVNYMLMRYSGESKQQAKVKIAQAKEAFDRKEESLTQRLQLGFHL